MNSSNSSACTGLQVTRVFTCAYFEPTVIYEGDPRSNANTSVISSTFGISNQLELSASNTVKVDYRLPVTCSDFNSTTVNSLGLDFIDLLPVTLSISYRSMSECGIEYGLICDM